MKLKTNFAQYHKMLLLYWISELNKIWEDWEAFTFETYLKKQLRKSNFYFQYSSNH